MNDIAKLKHHYSHAETIALEILEKRARKILRQHPNLKEFVMGMGMASFGDHKGEVVEAAYMEPVFSFLFEWDSLKLTGEAMRFTADGPVVRNW